jgi:hypothetical protein
VPASSCPATVPYAEDRVEQAVEIIADHMARPVSRGNSIVSIEFFHEKTEQAYKSTLKEQSVLLVRET